MKLSVIITTHNDSTECEQTITSVAAHSHGAEIVVVDDSSTQPFKSEFFGVRIIRNRHRCGVGPSRHIGVLAAKGEIILILDSHCRIACDLDAALSRLKDMPKTVMCGVCLGLDSRNMDVSKPNGVYHGATLNVFGRDPNVKEKRFQIFEANWNRQAIADNVEIPCVMGAAYAFHRDWFLHLDPLQHLRSWGEDESMLSIKSWLAGGNAALNTQLRVGHKFRRVGEKIPFVIPADHRMFNKLFAIHTLCPPELASCLVGHLRRTGDYVKGARFMEANWREVAIEQERNKEIFSRSFRDFAAQFHLPLPA